MHVRLALLEFLCHLNALCSVIRKCVFHNEAPPAPLQQILPVKIFDADVEEPVCFGRRLVELGSGPVKCTSSATGYPRSRRRGGTSSCARQCWRRPRLLPRKDRSSRATHERLLKVQMRTSTTWMLKVSERASLYNFGHRPRHDRRGLGHRRPRPLIRHLRQMSIFSAISMASSTSIPR